MKKYILSIDQGTTSCRAVLFNESANVIGIAQKEITQIFPMNGWVEHDPIEIWNTQHEVIKDVLIKNAITPDEVETIGITNQRETTVIWDKTTGKPVYNAIVWQSRQSDDICNKLKEEGLSDYVKQNTGLIIDPYFSATKIKWILDNVDGVMKRAEGGELLFGTIDTWIVWNLTKGRLHITDYSNASRTMLFNLKTLKWDELLLSRLDIPISMLPEVMESSIVYGNTDKSIFNGTEIPIAGIAGDQQASLFGQCCFDKGMVKNTYGTGCFILMNTCEDMIYSDNGLISTVAWCVGGKVEYALEGSVFMGGATVQWLRDGLKIINSSNESELYAMQVKDTNGVYFVPAFTGLGTPHWDTKAKGIITGITRGTDKNHIIRAGLESIAYQTYDVVKSMEKDSGINIGSMRVDGGASKNDFLMSFQSDILCCEIDKLEISESTALGVAFLAGLATGFWKNKEEIKSIIKIKKQYLPSISAKERESLIYGWNVAIKRASSSIG